MTIADANTVEDDFISFGRIVRTQGNKGEVRVAFDTDTPEDFYKFLEQGAYLALPDNSEPKPIEVEDVWLHKGFVIVKIKGVDDMNAAERLRGAQFQIARNLRPPLAEGEYYLDQLIGLKALDAETGGELGSIFDMKTIAGNLLMEIQKPDGSVYMAPFVSAFIRGVDLKKRQIHLLLPEGLDQL
jgi:16S rRNA processing protein RimM